MNLTEGRPGVLKLKEGKCLNAGQSAILGRASADESQASQSEILGGAEIQISKGGKVSVEMFGIQRKMYVSRRRRYLECLTKSPLTSKTAKAGSGTRMSLLSNHGTNQRNES